MASMDFAAKPRRGAALSWALYDWANSAFATTVMAGLFPLFFKQYWSDGVPATESTLRLGLANSIASVFIALTAPLLGAMADRGRARKRWLVAFLVGGVVGTGCLSVVGKGDWAGALGLFVLASVGFMGANVFYDSLLIAVAPPAQRDRVSALGYSLGYLGGGLLFALNVAMTLNPAAFGFPDAAVAVKVAFVSVAVWWTVFSIPLLLKVPEPAGGAAVGLRAAAVEGFRSVKSTFRRVRALRVTFAFLVAYWFYIDGVDTIVRMAVDYGMSIGLQTSSLIVALLITQFVGFPAALVFGRLGERWGAKRAVLLAVGVYAGVTVYAPLLRDSTGFYVLAVVIGLVQGGVQALSRSLFTRLIPRNHESEFFGFYNLLGKFAAILGPLLMGVVGSVTGSPRWSIFSILGLFVVGGGLLWRLDLERGRRDAEAYSELGEA